MKLHELKSKLEKYKIPEDNYSLNDGHLPEGHTLVRNYDDWWEVYYSERGRRSESRIFLTEDGACDYLWEIFVSDYRIKEK